MLAARYPGFSFGRIAPGEAEIIQPYREELTTHDGSFQGGVLGSLADFAGGSAAGTLLPPGWVNMTVDYTVKIVAPAKGEKLVARGRVVKASSLLAIAADDVYSVNGKDETLSATAFVTMRGLALRAHRIPDVYTIERTGFPRQIYAVTYGEPPDQTRPPLSL